MQKIIKELKEGLIARLEVLIEVEENKTFKKMYKEFLREM